MFGIDIDGMRAVLREGRSASLARRRRIVALCTLGMLDFALISLYQSGILPRMPDPPGRWFDSSRVNASHEAYAMGHPDGTSGATLFAATTVLATFGGTRETGRHPAWDLLMAGAVTVGAAAGAKYLWDMVTKEGKACPYCLVGAGLHFAMLAPAVREARDAARALR